jgi:DNA-binding transcriptional LysR family regulator
MRGPELAEMNAFIAVAERRSFASAAVQLGVSRSRLSETIRELEGRLGVRLLNRTTRSVAPTAAGERLLTQIRPLLADFDAVLDSINAFRDKPAGLLRLTVPPPVASFMLAPLLSRFLDKYPAINLEIAVDGALTDIVAGRFDAGMRAGDRVERDMIAVRIGEEIRSVVVAAPEYLARHKRPTTPRDLGAHNCIRFRFPSGVIVPWQFEKKGRWKWRWRAASLSTIPNWPSKPRSTAWACSTRLSATRRQRSMRGGWFPCSRIGGRRQRQSFFIIPVDDRYPCRCRRL